MGAEEIPKEDILLFFINLPLDEKKSMVSPIQIMKGMFLIKNELNMANFYEFKPYLYGPCSFQIYSDLLRLLQEHFIKHVDTRTSWTYYAATNEGSYRANSLTTKIDTVTLKGIIRIKQLIYGMSFLELLKYVYEKYPDYAKSSIIDLSPF